jgi:hypothetical protein
VNKAASSSSNNQAHDDVDQIGPVRATNENGDPAMTKDPGPQEEELLRIAVEAIESGGDMAELAAQGISIGEPIVGDEAKRMFLEEVAALEAAEARVDALLAQLAELGLGRHCWARFEVMFIARDPTAAAALATEYTGDDWTGEVTRSSAADGLERLHVRIVTRPVLVDRDVLLLLTSQMLELEADFTCELETIRLASVNPKRPWWRVW